MDPGMETEEGNKVTLYDMWLVAESPMYLQRTDMDGDLIRQEYKGRDMKYKEIKTVKAARAEGRLIIVVEIEEETP